MKLTPYDVTKLNLYKPGKNQKLLTEFVNSGETCAEVENYTQKSAKTAQSSLMVAAKKLGLNNSVRIAKRKDRVFLVRKDAIK